MNNKPSNYDLEKRTESFGIYILRFCKSIKEDTVTRPIIGQLVRSRTSIGANYMEANASSSKKDFRNKIYICKKEAQETRHWLSIMNECAPEKKDDIIRLQKEATELVLIFGKIVSTLNSKDQ